MRTTRATAAALCAILVVAFALRVIGVSYGLPAVYNPDEVSILSRALAFATGDLNPHNFLYPTLFFYVLFGWVGVFFVGARLLGVYPSVQAFEQQFFTDPTTVYVAARMLSVVCGTAAVAALYSLGRALFGRSIGLLAALFLAVAPYHVQDSHYVKHDVAASLLVILAYRLIVRVWPLSAASSTANARRALAAGAVCGAAFSLHYYTIFLSLPLALAIVLRWRESAGDAARMPALARMLAISASSAAAAFFLGSPFIVAEAGTAWRDITANRQIVLDRAVTGSAGAFGSAGAYLRMLWIDAMGGPLLVTTACAAIALAVRTPAVAALLLAFPIAFLVFISNTVAATRYLNPILPTIALLTAYAFSPLLNERRAAVQLNGPAGPSSSSSLWTPRRRAMFVTLAAALLAFAGLRASWRVDRFFLQDDTRTLAQRYIESTAPPGSGILVQPYSVMLRQSRESLRESLEATLGDASRASTKFQRLLALTPYPSPAYRLIFLGDGGLDADKIYVSYGLFSRAPTALTSGSPDGLAPDGFARLRELGVQYIVMKRYNTPDPAAQPLLAQLPREGRLLASFSPYRADLDADMTAAVEPYLHNTDARIDPALERPGPMIEVWRLHDRRP